ERPAVDVKQLIALLHEVAFVEVHLLQLSAHLRLHRNGRVGFDVSDHIDFHRNVLLRSFGNRHRNVTAAPAASPAAFAASWSARGSRAGRTARRRPYSGRYKCK